MRRLDTVMHENEDGSFILLRNDAISQNLLAGNRWEPYFTEIVGRLVQQGDTAIDCGANFGYHTIALAKAVGEAGAVHSYEPLRVIHQQLCANIFLNGLHNVVTHNFALGCEAGISTMRPVDYWASWVNIGDTELGEGGERVTVNKLDELDATNVSFIKLDVQGSEMNVIKGSTKIICENRPILFVEMEDLHLKKFGTSAQELINYIKSIEYDLYRIVNNYPFDHLCVPKSKAHLVENVRYSNLYTLEAD